MKTNFIAMSVGIIVLCSVSTALQGMQEIRRNKVFNRVNAIVQENESVSGNVVAKEESHVESVLSIFQDKLNAGKMLNYLKSLDRTIPFKYLPAPGKVLDLRQWEKIIGETYKDTTIKKIFIVPNKVELASLFALGLAGGWFLNYWWNSK